MNPLGEAPDANSQELPLPDVGKPVLVQCQGYRCMATLDENGKWWSFYSNVELSGVIKIIDDLFYQ